MTRRQTLAFILITAGILCVCLVYFGQVAPLIPWNGDDWNGFICSHSVFPSLADWNPARIFPEFLFPAFGLFSAYIVTPLCGEYISAFSITHTLLFSAAVTALSVVLFVFSGGCSAFFLSRWRGRCSFF